MPKVNLFEIAIARSGDKGDGSNVGIMAKSQEVYDFLLEQLSEEAVKTFFKDICKGEVTRYELSNLLSLNFILDDSLAGGGTETLITDAQGKVHGLALLHMELDVSEALLKTVSS